MALKTRRSVIQLRRSSGRARYLKLVFMPQSPHARSSCLPGLPTQRIQTASLLFGIANATRRGYILKRVPPDNSPGISSARVSSRRGSIGPSEQRVGRRGWGPRLVSRLAKTEKKLVSRFYARLVSYGKLETTLGSARCRAMILLQSPLPSPCLVGESVHGTACDFAFGSGSALRLGKRGGRGVGLLLRTPFHFFDTVFSFGNVQCYNSRSAAVFGILYTW